MAMMIEIDAGFWKLHKEDRKLLFLRYAETMDFGDIATEMKLGSEDAARMRNKRAIRKLINKIGGFKPYRDEDLEEVQTEEGSGQAPATTE
jgi:DNA-directed RNA polymerase specialized sigma24 family protein